MFCPWWAVTAIPRNESVLKPPAKTNLLYLSSQCAKYIFTSIRTAVILLQDCNLRSEISRRVSMNIFQIVI